MSGDPGPSKAISSLAKKPSDVTRHGTQKLKFVPVLPARRKKEQAKPEEVVPVPVEQSPSTERDRTRADGPGRGRGRGIQRPPVTMTASGPFAMGPAMAGNNARRAIPRSNFAPAVGAPPGFSGAFTPSTKMEEGKVGVKTEEDEYSEPDDGVEIIDIDDIKNLDWMAPDALKKEQTRQKHIKKEESGVDTANALDLSESEDEDEMENIQENFMPEYGTDPSLRQDRLFFFQFPSPFPQFVPQDVEQSTSAKKVMFAPDTKAEPPGEGDDTQRPDGIEIDGLIGQLEIYRSGAVKMRLENGILLDVASATQPSFLQYAVHVNLAEREMSVLGEVNKKFIMSPDIDALLLALERVEAKPSSVIPGEEGLIQMK